MSRTRAFSAIAAVTAFGFALTSCSQGGPDAAADAPLIIYSNSTSDGRGDWLVEQAADAGFEVEYVEDGGAAITERLIAERGNPIADVVFGPNTVSFENLKAADALDAYTPSWADTVTTFDADGHYFSIVQEPIMIVYKDEAHPGGVGAPSDWTDLFENETYHGRYEVQTSLGGATTQMVIASLLSRHRDEAGHLSISDEGWDAISKFYEFGSPAIEGTDLFARMKADEVDFGQMWLAGKVSREAEYGVTTTPTDSSVGVPIVHQNIGLVSGSSRPDRAKAFIDWFGSAEVQAAWSREFATAPTNVDAVADADQDAVATTDSFTPQDLDWPWVAEHLASWVEEIELNHIP